MEEKIILLYITYYKKVNIFLMLKELKIEFLLFFEFLIK